MNTKKEKLKKNKPTKEKTTTNILKWKDVSIGQKYLTAFFLSAVLIIAAVVVVFIELEKAQTNIKELNHHSKLVSEMSELASIIQVKDVQIADYLLTRSTRYADAFKQYQEDFDKSSKTIKKEITDERQIKLLDHIIKNDKKINDLFSNEIQTALDHDQEYMARSTRNQSSELRKSTVRLIDQLMGLARAEEAESSQNANSKMTNSIIVLLVAGVAAIIIGAVMMIFVSRQIANSLKKVIHMTKETAEGHFDAERYVYRGKDEIGQLAGSVNQMQDKVRDMLIKVSDASQTVSARSAELTQSANEVKAGNEQVASTMQQIASGAETQAASASSLSESMQNFVQVVSKSEESSNEIANKSDHILSLTGKGSELMNKSIKQMTAIDQIVSDAVTKVQGLDQQSAEISKLISVIKDIASQTNLLSLNAAIEAARAGEHGRGFAVVADEVRKLSEQVATSVEEITTIVTNIQQETDQVVTSLHTGYQEVETGTKQIAETGNSFQLIQESVSHMTTKIFDISKSLQDIATSSNEMNTLIEEIASVSEESAAGVEQTAASAQQTSSAMEEVSDNAGDLSKLAEHLHDELQVFRL